MYFSLRLLIMPRTATEAIKSSTKVRATKKIGSAISPVGVDDCGCVKEQGCCQDKGCCREGKCPAEMERFGCAGDDFSMKINDRQDLVSEYISKNKDSVTEYFKTKGVQIKK
jgi:hypothetical protein